MPVASSGNISIKTAAGSGRSIDTDGRTDISSGSLVTLSTGNVVTSGNTIDGASPHGMREFYGYTHTQTMSIAETNYARVSSAGNAATANDFWGTNSTGPSNAIFSLKAEVVNSGNNQSDFNLYIYNTWNETGAGSNYYWTSAGTQTAFSSYTNFQVYKGRFTGSGYSNLCPDSFKIDWSTSVTETDDNGDTEWTVLNESGWTGISDNTFISYPQTAGTHNFGKRFRAWAETSGDAEIDGGHARTQATVTFTPSFRKSGYYDKTGSYTHKFYLSAYVVTTGEGGN